jgi:prepilin-type N-terminal cleavage/methylation domain-containing protein
VKGFSLIEVLVVMAIVALISIMAMPSISSYFQVSLNSATRDIASTVKEAYNSAVVRGNVYRLVYDIGKAQYWVESGPPNVLLDTKESLEKEERRKRFARLSEAPPPSAFNLDKGVTRKKLSLPRGVDFEDIVTEQKHEPITEGMAYTHIFPHGLTERTIIHLKDTSKHHISLVISPLIGRTDLYERYVTAAELEKQ